jgi:hypothetical protein
MSSSGWPSAGHPSRSQPGELPYPSPASLGDGAEQRRLLTAQRFALVHGTAPILGLQRSRAIPTDYQLVPLLLSHATGPSSK